MFSDAAYLLTRIKKVKRLSKEEEIILFTTLQNSVTSKEEKQLIKDILVMRNMPLVISISKRRLKKLLRYGSLLEFSDMVDEGVVGLITAINAYKLDKYTRFGTYATYAINSAINKYVAGQKRSVYVPLKYEMEFNKKCKEYNAIEEEEVTDTSESEEYSEDFINMYQFHQFPINLNATTAKGTELMEFIISTKPTFILENIEFKEDLQLLITQSIQAEIKKATAKKDDFKIIKDILILKYGTCELESTNQDLSLFIKLSRDKINTLEKRGLEILKKFLFQIGYFTTEELSELLY
jgi:RNA polymerase sigma factor (sigma-70 family)